MKVIRNIADFPALSNVVVTSGTFDGCHVGHQKILHQLIKAARSIQGHSVVITYWPHPRIVLGKEEDHFKLLYTIEERIELLAQFDIDYLVILEFTPAFADQSSEEFIRRILVDALRTQKLIIGYNHRFGKNREGSFDYLQQHAGTFGFSVEEIQKQVVDDEGISSTKIRKALADGDVALAAKYLDHYFWLEGTVISGNKLGRELGFPTANIHPIQHEIKLIPKDGVYAVQVVVAGQMYSGMLNIGLKPSVDGTKKSIEVHIFDFSGDIYDQQIRIQFVQRLRDEQKFPHLDALKEALQNDMRKAKAILMS